MTATSARGRRPLGFSLVEATISMVIVGVMLAAVLNTVGYSAKMQLKGGQRQVALLLANDLMSEIVGMPYSDPDQTPALFGVEPAEGVADRADFDDVDDYHGWSILGAVRRGGTAIPSGIDYEREVEVVWLQQDDLLAVSATESGIKRIRVHVRWQGMPLLTIEAIRTAAWPNPGDAGEAN